MLRRFSFYHFLVTALTQYVSRANFRLPLTMADPRTIRELSANYPRYNAPRNDVFSPSEMSNDPSRKGIVVESTVSMESAHARVRNGREHFPSFLFMREGK